MRDHTKVGYPCSMAEDLDETLADEFWAVSHRLRHLSRAALAPWDIPPSYVRALRCVARHRRLRLNELSEQLCVAPRSVTDLVDGLERRGLVRRLPDPDDRRATLVEVAAPGTALLAAVASSRGAETARFFDRLSADDRAHLRRMLRCLVEEQPPSATSREPEQSGPPRSHAGRSGSSS